MPATPCRAGGRTVPDRDQWPLPRPSPPRGRWSRAATPGPARGSLAQEVEIMLRSITVGLDGSRESRAAVEWAAREAALRDLPL
ncbi:universal stress protein, partial [Streptomyces asoensis]|uniref:universal stress protein n=1 Tax=Streptomyces asoensis TaxID=249586 RepID=UPI003F4CB457